MPPKRISGSPGDRHQMTISQMLGRSGGNNGESDAVRLSTGSSNPMSLSAYSQMDVKERILGQRDRSQLGAHRLRALNIGFQDGDGSAGIVTESMEFSLVCPYSKTRMSLPVRSRECKHIQCVDVDSWVALVSGSKSARDPMPKCPVCSQRVMLSSLTVDEWVSHVLVQLPPNVKQVMFDRDGRFYDASGVKSAGHDRDEYVVEATQGPSPVRVKTEPGLENGVAQQNCLPSADGSPLLRNNEPSMTAGDVVFVSASESRVAPSSFRRWRPYCPSCFNPLSLDGQDSADLTTGQLECCSRRTARVNWPMVREFDTSSATMELTDDRTLILIGPGVNRLAPYLAKGGYVLSESGCMWTSVNAVTRPEIDFLEAAMEQASANPTDPTIVMSSALPPGSLRYRWKSNQGTSFTQGTPTPAFASEY